MKKIPKTLEQNSKLFITLQNIILPQWLYTKSLDLKANHLHITTFCKL